MNLLSDIVRIHDLMPIVRYLSCNMEVLAAPFLKKIKSEGAAAVLKRSHDNLSSRGDAGKDPQIE